MDERMEEESPEDAPDPVQIDRNEDINDEVLDFDDDFQMDRCRDDEDPFVPAKRGFRNKLLRIDDETGSNRRKDGERKDRKTPEPRNTARSPSALVKVHNPEAVRLDKLKGLYDPNAFISRLEFIMDACPPLEKDAFIMLVNFLKETKRSPSQYSLLYTRVEGRPWTKDADVPPMDKEWFECTQAATMTRTDALLHELKKQKDEGVKESTRRAMEELLLHYGLSGQLNEAFKQYTRGMREYCMQMKHIIVMFTSWLECAVLLFEWGRVSPLVSQSERALVEAEEAENQSSAPGGRLGRNQFDQLEASRKSNKLLIETCRSKVNAMMGLFFLEQRHYKNAYERFMKVDVDHISDRWILAPFDLARYGALCALATLDRAEMKAKCLDSKFRKILESEPMLVEAVTCYTRSQFSRFFELINSIQDAMLVDPYFSGHVSRVYEMMKRRALAQYLAPFAVADLSTMGQVFGMTKETLVREIISLIDKKQVRGRFDEREGVIEMRRADERLVTHQALADTCDRLCARAEWTIMRALIQSGKIMVNADESKPARGKRRTNDENHREDSAHGPEANGAGIRAGGGGQQMLRNVRSSMMRMVGRGGGGVAAPAVAAREERSERAPARELATCNEADSSAEGVAVSDPPLPRVPSASASHHSVSLPQPIPLPSAASSSTHTMDAEPSEPHM